MVLMSELGDKIPRFDRVSRRSELPWTMMNSYEYVLRRNVLVRMNEDCYSRRVEKCLMRSELVRNVETVYCCPSKKLSTVFIR